MSLNDFILCQQEKVQAGLATLSGQKIVPDPLPAGVASTAIPPPHVHAMLATLREGYGRMIDVFDEIPEQMAWRRRAVKDFMASEKVLEIEAQIGAQCRMVWEKEEEEEKEAALRRVEDGVKYLISLVEWKINQKKK